MVTLTAARWSVDVCMGVRVVCHLDGREVVRVELHGGLG